VLGEAMYEVNFIKARRLVKGQPEYLIKLKGFDDDKYDTCTRQNLCHDLTRGPRSVGAAMLSSRKTAPAKHQDLYMPRRRPSLVQPRRGE